MNSFVDRLRSLVGFGNRQADARACPAQEQAASWYDGFYETSEEYRKHYTRSVYYPFWAVVADRIARMGSRSVLDIGCGPGQFAMLLADRGISSYHGVDFSDIAIKKARARCPHFTFITADIRSWDGIANRCYDVVTCLECLEHIEDDVDVLRRLRRGCTVLATVPSFQFVSHVRWFSSCDEVAGRYGALFDGFSIVPLRLDDKQSVLYLFEGLRAGE